MVKQVVRTGQSNKDNIGRLILCPFDEHDINWFIGAPHCYIIEGAIDITKRSLCNVDSWCRKIHLESADLIQVARVSFLHGERADDDYWSVEPTVI